MRFFRFLGNTSVFTPCLCLCGVVLTIYLRAKENFPLPLALGLMVFYQDPYSFQLFLITFHMIVYYSKYVLPSIFWWQPLYKKITWKLCYAPWFIPLNFLLIEKKLSLLTFFFKKNWRIKEYKKKPED